MTISKSIATNGSAESSGAYSSPGSNSGDGAVSPGSRGARSSISGGSTGGRIFNSTNSGGGSSSGSGVPNVIGSHYSSRLAQRRDTFPRTNFAMPTIPTNLVQYSPDSTNSNFTTNTTATSSHQTSSPSTAGGATSVTNAVSGEDSHYRQMASTLVDNLLAKAIVKASQELAFTYSRPQGTDHFGHTPPNHQTQESQAQKPSISHSSSSSHQVSTDSPSITSTCSSISNHSSTTNTTPLPAAISQDRQQSLPATGPSTTNARPSVGSYRRSSLFNIDINGNPPEIQIDLIGPRTPSPAEESKFELPVTVKQYKFKVAYDQESMLNADEEEDEEEEEDDDDEDDQMAEDQYDEDGMELDQDECLDRVPETEQMEYSYSSAAGANSGTTGKFVETNSGKPQQQEQLRKKISNGSKIGNEVDVATSPELQIDLVQAQQISQHIVTEIIDEAVKVLNSDVAMRQAIKRDQESFSKLSCHSSRTAGGASVTGNCCWINRIRHALSRLMRNTCLCAKNQENFPEEV